MKMKKSQKRGAGSGGFTLMELLIVISLIAVLAAMVSAAMPGIINKVARSRTGLAIKGMEAGLSSYKLDNGWYPINRGNPVEGAFVLYQYLSGDFDVDGELDPVDDDSKIYVPGIDWNTAQNNSQQRVGRLRGVTRWWILLVVLCVIFVSLRG